MRLHYDTNKLIALWKFCAENLENQARVHNDGQTRLIEFGGGLTDKTKFNSGILMHFLDVN